MERLAICPDAVFRDRWPGWGPFLGTGKGFRAQRSIEEWVPVAERMARENGGRLQSAVWLEKNGCSGLCHAMRKHPGLFAHIEQERRNTNGRLIDEQG